MDEKLGGIVITRDTNYGGVNRRCKIISNGQREGA